ncbi:MAG: hypothetical protein N2595_09865 [bacterium]|nr:hypothetical protein [bacterium]
MSAWRARDILTLTHADRPEGRVGLVHRVLGVRELTRHTFVLRIERNNVACTAGQCVTLGLHGSGINREYSLYSGEQDDYFEFLIREVEGGVRFRLNYGGASRVIW